MVKASLLMLRSWFGQEVLHACWRLSLVRSLRAPQMRNVKETQTGLHFPKIFGNDILRTASTFSSMVLRPSLDTWCPRAVMLGYAKWHLEIRNVIGTAGVPVGTSEAYSCSKFFCGMTIVQLSRPPRRHSSCS